VTVLYGWECNRRFGIALATRQRLFYIYVRAQWPQKLTEMEMSTLPTFLIVRTELN